MTNVFLAPVDAPNFEDSIRTPIDLDAIEDRPEALNSTDRVRLWGTPPGTRNRSNFEKMQTGDVVLFCEGDSYVGSGRVETTFEDDEGWASANVWDDSESTLLYTLSDFRAVSVPRSAVNRIFEYSDSYSPQGLMRVADGKVSNDPAAIELALEQYSEKHG
ncbi:hypothetical protein [Halovivax gelatinilyticus]|uniref:hypothetical protein n=1 Tax=Halovivax gelatinilyticus TaxID=2961597 RepID=UPI0020CA63B7|nr:hypothetical protein [Halovivax gelatinilyticus]